VASSRHSDSENKTFINRRYDVSHIVEIKTQVRDPVAVRAACQRLGLAAPIEGEHRLFTSTVTGLGVSLPGWRFPVVCELSSGQLKYDNYNERWGAQTELQKLLQSYAVAKTLIEARRKGHTVTEQSLSDGSVKLTIQVNGGAV
jgi:hypothetical protein